MSENTTDCGEAGCSEGACGNAGCLPSRKFPSGWPVDHRLALKVKRLHPDAKLPKYATAGAACFDLVAVTDYLGERGGFPVEFFEGQTFGTGLAFEVPQGHVLLIYSRSGHGFNNDTRLANCVGVIDSDYRGEVKVRLFNDGAEPLIVKRDQRIAQAMLVPIPDVRLVEVDELSSTERGAGGFGSTGT